MDHLLSERVRGMDASGIRRVFELGVKLARPINLSIGQPDFVVPEVMRNAMAHAAQANHNGYSVTQGIPSLIEVIRRHLHEDLGWTGGPDQTGCIVTSGTSGGLLCAAMALLDPGDEIIIPDPYFVMYPQLGALTGARAVTCNTYPDFRMTAERIEPLITPRTKAVLLNSPSNPCGTVLTQAETAEVLELCRSRRVLLISDEIYDAFCFEDAREQGRCPSPARGAEDVLLIRGFGKSYGCTGWRVGYAAGPRALIQEMAKVQQYTFVCAPTPAQHACIHAFDIDLTTIVSEYANRRDLVLRAFDGVTRVARPGGAFYAFVEVPPHLGKSASEFVERAIERSVLTIPGKVFSSRDTHFRLSFATRREVLDEGLAILRELMLA
ncbi:MAG: aminotransferase class I/II-fold pyridoxal phosphate-dependent enzyme [Phycisphaeraceae bacterium]|nr:aminotransferase class I/II-fold pyridoxal phosphate-dependent enzyme [Phycisphaeraceae bacterium]